MFKYKYIFTIVALMIPALSWAQYSVDNKKAVAEFEKGQQMLDMQPDKALDHFSVLTDVLTASRCVGFAIRHIVL